MTLVMLLGLVGCGPKSPVAPDPSLPGNVLVVVLDDLGIDKLGLYDATYPSPTPVLDGLAAEGVRFDNAYGAPVGSAARAQLLTGRHARRTGIGGPLGPDRLLAFDAVTVPEALAQVPGPRWRTAAFGVWGLAGRLAPAALQHPNREGFDHFDGTLGDVRAYDGWQHVVNGRARPEGRYLTTVTTDRALKRLQKLPEPWFLYVGYHAPHGPLHAPPAALTGGVAVADDAPPHQLYDAMVQSVDTELGRLLDGMEPALRSRTTVIVVGDNGSPVHAFPPEAGADRRRLAGSLLEGGVRVPLVISGPDVAEPGSRSDALVHLTDLFPTVLDLAGVPTDGRLQLGEVERDLDGTSLRPLLRGEPGGHRYVYTELFSPNGPGPHQKDARAVRNATHLLVRAGKTEALYRLDGPNRWETDTDLMRGDGPTELADVTAMVELIAEMERLELELRYEGF